MATAVLTRQRVVKSSCGSKNQVDTDQLGSETRPAEVGFEAGMSKMIPNTEQQLVCGFGAAQPIATGETSFVLPAMRHIAEPSNKVKKERKRYLDVTRGTADLDDVFESRMKGSARIN